MTDAQNIASHGRAGRVTAATIASFGRIKQNFAEFARVEIMRIASFVNRIITGDSTI
jgi:hypothetical protein